MATWNVVVLAGLGLATVVFAGDLLALLATSKFAAFTASRAARVDDPNPRPYSIEKPVGTSIPQTCILE